MAPEHRSHARVLDERWQRNHDFFKRRLDLKEKAIAYLGGACQKCGYSACPSALDFHHLDNREKDFAISSKQSWKEIVVELRKCVLLCSNCHRETHAGWHPELLVLDESCHGLDWGLDWDDDESDTDPSVPNFTP